MVNMESYDFLTGEVIFTHSSNDTGHKYIYCPGEDILLNTEYPYTMARLNVGMVMLCHVLLERMVLLILQTYHRIVHSWLAC